MTPDELVLKLNKMAEQADKNAKDYSSEDRDYWQAAARAFRVSAGEAAKLTTPKPVEREEIGALPELAGLDIEDLKRQAAEWREFKARGWSGATATIEGNVGRRVIRALANGGA